MNLRLLWLHLNLFMLVVKSILNVFLNHPDATAQEKDLIKAVPEQEVLTALISDCKVQLPGAAGGGGPRGKKKK